MHRMWYIRDVFPTCCWCIVDQTASTWWWWVFSHSIILIVDADMDLWLFYVLIFKHIKYIIYIYIWIWFSFMMLLLIYCWCWCCCQWFTAKKAMTMVQWHVSSKVNVTMACECEKFKQANLIKQVLDRSTCLFQDVTCLDNNTERHCVAHEKACVTKLQHCYVMATHNERREWYHLLISSSD